MHKRLKRCPVCNLDLVVREFFCPDCEVTIRGDFKQSELSSLSPAQQDFVKIFILAQGSIKEVEKRLGISYPTVKNKLNEIIKHLSGQESQEETVNDLLTKIEEGHLTVEQAVSFLQKK